MKGVDNFLEDILNENTVVHIREYALKRNCSHSEIIHFINLIKKHNEDWIFFQKTESGGFFTINNEYEYQIKNFLLNGGFTALSERNKRLLQTEIETLNLINAQQKEIKRNKKISYISLIISILSLFIAICLLLLEFSKFLLQP